MTHLSELILSHFACCSPVNTQFCFMFLSLNAAKLTLFKNCINTHLPEPLSVFAVFLSLDNEPSSWTSSLQIDTFIILPCFLLLLPSFTFSFTSMAVAAKDLSSFLGEAPSSGCAMKDRHVGSWAWEVQQRVELLEDRNFWSGLFAYWRALSWCRAWEQTRSREETNWNRHCLSPNSSQLFFFHASSPAVKQ